MKKAIGKGVYFTECSNWGGKRKTTTKQTLGQTGGSAWKDEKTPDTTHPDPHRGRRKPNVAGHPMAHMHAAPKHTQDKMWKKNQQGKWETISDKAYCWSYSSPWSEPWSPTVSEFCRPCYLYTRIQVWPGSSPKLLTESGHPTQGFLLLPR